MATPADAPPTKLRPESLAPRFHPQKNDDLDYEKNPEKKPQIQSSLILLDSKQTTKKPLGLLKTQQVLTVGTANTFQSQRRSLRLLASNLAEFTNKYADCSQSRRRFSEVRH